MTWYFLIFVVLGAPLTLVLHEAAHVLAYYLDGVRAAYFRPWPHKVVLDDGSVRWYRGRTCPTEYLTRTGAVASSVAPLAKGTILAVFWGVASVSWWHLWPFAAWELVDVGFWLYCRWTGKAPSDAARFAEEVDRARLV